MTTSDSEIDRDGNLAGLGGQQRCTAKQQASPSRRRNYPDPVV